MIKARTTFEIKQFFDRDEFIEFEVEVEGYYEKPDPQVGIYRGSYEIDAVRLPGATSIDISELASLIGKNSDAVEIILKNALVEEHEKMPGGAA